MMRSRRHRIVLALLVAVLVAAGSAAVIALAFGDDEGDVLEGGPLADPSNSSATGAPVELNLRYSWGGTSLINEGDEAVTRAARSTPSSGTERPLHRTAKVAAPVEGGPSAN